MKIEIVVADEDEGRWVWTCRGVTVELLEVAEGGSALAVWWRGELLGVLDEPVGEA